MHKPGYFASQGMFYTEVDAREYVQHHRLKFWHNPNWTPEERSTILDQIITWLSKPKMATRYDFIAIAGQLFGLGMIQNPLTRICSDYGSFLQEVDPNYKLVHPAPDEVNEWLKDRIPYEIYGKYVRD